MTGTKEILKATDLLNSVELDLKEQLKNVLDFQSFYFQSSAYQFLKLLGFLSKMHFPFWDNTLKENLLFLKKTSTLFQKSYFMHDF